MRRSLLVAVALVCAACGSHGGTSQRVSAAALPGTVLQPADLPEFSQFGAGPQVASDAHSGPRHDPARFGRTSGWISRYRRTTTVPHGPLVVESRTDLFPSAGDAGKDLAAYRDEGNGEPGAKAAASPAIGDEAIAFTFGAASDRFVLVAWRFANVTASVLVEGFSVTEDDATRLARAQQRRLARAAR